MMAKELWAIEKIRAKKMGSITLTIKNTPLPREDLTSLIEARTQIPNALFLYCL